MTGILRISLGTLLVTVGAVGIILPVMPGWILFLPGLLLLSFDVPIAARLLCRMEHRIPGLRRPFARFRASMARRGIHQPQCPPGE